MLPADPLSKAAALALAHAHVAHLNAQAPPPGTQRWVVSKPVEYTPYWYFDYQTDLPATRVPNLADYFGYAPGYLLWKQTHIRTTVSWGDYATLPQREQLYQQASRLASQLVAAPLTLARLRAQLRLPLPELVSLAHAVRALTDAAAQSACLFSYLHAQALADARLDPL